MRSREPKRAPTTRAFFRIGSGGVCYLLMTIIILAAAVHFQANLLFWAFGLMIGGLLVSVVLSVLMLRGMSVQRVLPSHGVAGEPMLLRYQLTNHKRFLPAFGVVVSETWRGSGWRARATGPITENPPRLKGRPYGWVLHVGPNQTVQAEAPCWPARRGVLKFDRIMIQSSFPFGVLRRTWEIEQSGQVLVYPHLYRINRRVLTRVSENDPAGRKRLDRGGGNEEFFGLREYRPGDSLKMIEWRRTARTGELVSREMTQPSPPRMMIALDLADLPPPPKEDNGQGFFRRAKQKTPDLANDPVEQAVSLCASLICDGYFHGFQVGMAVWGVPCIPFPVHHSLPHRTKILEAFAQLDVNLRLEKRQSLPLQPTVVVRPGSGGRPTGTGQTVIGTAQMQEFVVEMEEGSSAILGKRLIPMTRRQQIQEGAL